MANVNSPLKSDGSVQQDVKIFSVQNNEGCPTQTTQSYVNESIDNIAIIENDSAVDRQNCYHFNDESTEGDYEFINGDVDVKEPEVEPITNKNLGCVDYTLPVIVILPSFTNTLLSTIGEPKFEIRKLKNLKKIQAIAEIKKTLKYSDSKLKINSPGYIPEHFIAEEKIKEIIFPKPPFQLKSLIALALNNCETHCLRVTDIRKFISYHFPYFVGIKTFSNSLRHALCCGLYFIKVGVDKSKDNMWATNPYKIQPLEKKIKKNYEKNNLEATNAMFDPENMDSILSGKLKHEFCRCENPGGHHSESSTEMESHIATEFSPSSSLQDFTTPSSTDAIISDEIYLHNDNDDKIDVKEEWLAVEDFGDSEFAHSSIGEDFHHSSNCTEDFSSSPTSQHLATSTTTVISEELYVQIEEEKCLEVESFADSEFSHSSIGEGVQTQLESMPSISTHTSTAEISSLNYQILPAEKPMLLKLIPLSSLKKNKRDTNEIRRRKALRTSLNCLKDLVPQKRLLVKCSKVEILTGATDYIRQLVSLENQLVKEKSATELKNRLLSKKLKQLDPLA